jgi:hypothetical protein
MLDCTRAELGWWGAHSAGHFAGMDEPERDFDLRQSALPLKAYKAK